MPGGAEARGTMEFFGVASTLVSYVVVLRSFTLTEGLGTSCQEIR